ncbi:hypothetical protein ACLOJK_026803 [Asimina triloba]
MSGTHHGAGHTEESQSTTVQYGGHHIERLPERNKIGRMQMLFINRILHLFLEGIAQKQKIRRGKQLRENHRVRNRLLRRLDHQQDKDSRVKGLRTKINEVARRNVTDAIGAIWDATTSNQGLVISAEKLDTDQRTALMERHTTRFCTAVVAPGPQQSQNQNRPAARPAAR